ncbi:MAG: hypothetical protein IPO25_12815 [Saprospiraceae bacterium]|nr:hypothetical protein [Saprospiraceae bacterium]
MTEHYARVKNKQLDEAMDKWGTIINIICTPFLKPMLIVKLFIELEFLENFFKDPNNHQWLSGMDENYYALKEIHFMGSILKALDKIKITTPNIEIREFQ